MNNKNNENRETLKTPMLSKMSQALNEAYMKMSNEEIEELNNEIEKANEQNCPPEELCIANLYRWRVNTYYKRYIQKE